MTTSGARGEPGSTDRDTGGGQSEDEQRRARSRRRRHIDEVFGTVLPAVTDDERDPGERSGFTAEHYRRSRPPHHGGQS